MLRHTTRAEREAKLMALYEGAVALRWKDEDLLRGQPIGPMHIVYGDGRAPCDMGWQTRAVVERIGRTFRLPVEVS